MDVSSRRGDVVDDPAYGSALAGRARGGAWSAVLVSLGMALAVAALVVFVPAAAAAGGRVPALVGRRAD